MTARSARLRTLHWLLRSPSSDLRYRVHCRAFALAATARLTLPDALDSRWWLPSGALWLGAALLAACGAPLGWLLCALGTLAPHLFLEDQLSQSVFLCFCASTAVACAFGSRSGRGRRLTEELPSAVRVLTAGVYAFAVIHKLNSGYFDPRVSCANEGLRVLFANLRFPPPEAWGDLASASFWPAVHLVVESAIPVLLLWRPGVGVLLGAAMHLPLTIIFAPSFAFAMLSGWVCFFTSGELGRALAAVRRHWVRVLCLGAAGAALSRLAFFPERWSEDPEWCIKEALLWFLYAAIAVAVSADVGLATPGATVRRWTARVVVPGALFTLNALTPYTGLQFHHAAAMLSNLRIDQGCWNSWLFPEVLRGRDPYVRLDRVVFAPGRATPEASGAFVDRLWEPAALLEARARWCRTHPEPLEVELSYQGRHFRIPDLCADGAWPLGEPPLRGFRRFQTSLTRDCRQRCGH